MRIEKRKAVNIRGMQMHNERESLNHSNEDIDSSKSHLNYQLVKCENYKEKINKELDERYHAKRSIRKDAVVCCEVLFTSDKKFFENLTEEKERLYFEKSLEFLKEKVGERNVISATIHKDETTPHMHCVFTPLDSDGNLKYKSFINGRNDLIKFQDEYHEKISEFFPELKRGKKTSKKHLAVEEFKIEQKQKQLEEKNLHLDNQLKQFDKNIKINSSIEQVIKDVKNTKTFLYTNVRKITDEELNFLATKAFQNNKLEKENLDLKTKNSKLEKQNSVMSDYISKLEIDNLRKDTEFRNFKKNLEKLGFTEALDSCKTIAKFEKCKTLEEKQKMISEIKQKENLNKAEKLILANTTQNVKTGWKKLVTRERKRGFGIGD